METLFFYGTLLDPHIAELVLGRPLRSCRPLRGTLDDYRAVLVAGKPFPGLVAQPGMSAAGLLVHGITPEEMEKLVRYEERVMYGVETHPIRTEDGATHTAKVFMPRRRVPLTDIPWDLDTWRRRNKRAYLAMMRGRL